MKKIILYINERSVDKNKLTFSNPYFSAYLATEQKTIQHNDYDFFLIDTDEFPNFQQLINKYKTTNNKFWAITSNLTKNNVLTLYDCGFDNIIEREENIIKTLEIMTNPNNIQNNDFSTQNIITHKKALLINTSLEKPLNFNQIFNEFHFNSVLFASTDDAIFEIKNEQYDVIIAECNPKDEKLIKEIENSLINKKTLVIFISTCKKQQKLFENIKQNCFFIEKTKNKTFIISQIKNILKIEATKEKLYKENTLLKTFIKQSNLQPIITDSNFIIISSESKYINLPKNEYFFNFLNKKNIEYPKEKISQFLNTIQSYFNFTIEYNNKFLEININKIYSSKEKLENFLILISDITKNKEEENNKETFIATITHDLKSPIKSEELVLKEMLNGTFGELNKTQKEIIEEMFYSKKNISLMINNLLTRYNISQQKFELVIKNNNYKEIINKITNLIQHLLSEKKQQLEVIYQSSTEIFDFDDMELERAILNLLSNANEHTPTNGKITIKIEENNSSIITKIEDNGQGMAPEMLDKIFDKNVSSAKIRKKASSGLGLYIAKSIIEAHNGTISVESTLGKGTTFTFMIPKKQITNQKEKV